MLRNAVGLDRIVKGIAIRQAEPKDAQVLAEMWWDMHVEHQGYNEAFFATHPAERCKKLWIDYLERLLSDPKAAIYVSEVGEEVIGMVVAHVRDRPPIYSVPTEMEIDAAFVKTLWRRKGVFRKLASVAEEWGRSSGARLVVLQVASENPAVEAYRKLGFEVVMHRMFRKVNS